MGDDQVREPSRMVQLLLLAYLGLVPVACIAGLVALVRHSWWLVYITFMLQALNVLIERPASANSGL